MEGRVVVPMPQAQLVAGWLSGSDFFGGQLGEASHKVEWQINLRSVGLGFWITAFAQGSGVLQVLAPAGECD